MAEKAISKQVKGDRKHRYGHRLVGILLAGAGFFWFAKKIGWIPVTAGSSSIFWPVVVMVLGISIIIGSRHKRAKQGE
jgi:hypothetical protein